MPQLAVEMKNTTKMFGRTVAVMDFSLEVEKGSFVTLLGPSGCGKTTSLRMIAGFYDPDSGEVYIGGKLVNGIPPFKRNTAMVFQDYALFPHMSVFENIAYGLKIRKLPKKEIEKKVKDALALVNLQGYEDRSPMQLSGGEQQRVALSRALIIEPEVLLFDEPLSNLDAKLRLGMRREIRELQRKLKISAVYVTHDQEEALSISDKVAVMNKGLKMQEGPPQEIYFKPKNRFVAEFIGMRNFIEGEVIDVTKEEMSIDIGVGEPLWLYPDPAFNVGDKATVTCRSESIVISKNRPKDRINVLKGGVESTSFLGSNIQYFINTNGIEWLATISDPDPEHVFEGDVYLILDKSKLHAMKP
ncbi:MAG: Trehalose/maltose import ATP-binding protein MalK [Candidatus Bathyarchaeota archaeon BA1]|nr:MAG: Trehalose/maltose import ATP-binding protein MalK [Candidatus Bathyarchaeota archaeon BA1]